MEQETEPSRGEEEGPLDEPEEGQKERKVQTTQEELEGYFAVKLIARDIVDSKRIAIRDTLSYCGVLFDDNNRKPICRLHFNKAQKYFGVFDDQKKETRYAIDSTDDIFKYFDQIKAVVAHYLETT